jgi:hypothetical protein
VLGFADGRHHMHQLRRKILDKFGGTSTIDASIMVFGLHRFCVSTGHFFKVDTKKNGFF